MSSWFVYILRCSNDALYVGISNDLEKRIEKHNAGKGAKYTRAFRPVVLAWSKNVSSESVARKREAKLKKLSHAEKEELIAILPKSKTGMRGRS